MRPEGVDQPDLAVAVDLSSLVMNTTWQGNSDSRHRWHTDQELRHHPDLAAALQQVDWQLVHSLVAGIVSNCLGDSLGRGHRHAWFRSFLSA